MFEEDSLTLWEEKEKPDPEREAVEIAFSEAKKYLWKAYETIASSVDGDSPLFDRVMSFAGDIEDMIDNLTLNVRRNY